MDYHQGDYQGDPWINGACNPLEMVNNGVFIKR